MALPRPPAHAPPPAGLSAAAELPGTEPPPACPAGQALAAVRAHVLADGYPCIMAASAARRGQLAAVAYGPIGDARTADRLAIDLAAFAAAPDPDRGYRSLVAVFARPGPAGEAAFEAALWQLLGALHRRDAAAWDASVSDDPASPSFSFSFAGRAFYVVGMHPAASRRARRFAAPLLVFNLHAQFEQLREEGRYGRVRDTIRGRDVAFDGSVNPMVTDFGEASDARQYSGRAVGDAWRCPFHARPDAHADRTPPPRA